MIDDWDRRELCPDGACVGVIGPDGYCRECGKPGSSETQGPRTRGLRTDEEVAEQLEENITKGDIAASPEDFDDRALCPDGACIGILGPDGRCRECGAQGELPAKVPKPAQDDDDDFDDDDELEDDELEDEDEDEDEDELEDGDDDSADHAGESDRDDEDRELCPDGACIGLIGKDGKCRECGLSADADV